MFHLCISSRIGSEEPGLSNVTSQLECLRECVRGGENCTLVTFTHSTVQNNTEAGMCQLGTKIMQDTGKSNTNQTSVLQKHIVDTNSTDVSCQSFVPLTPYNTTRITARMTSHNYLVKPCSVSVVADANFTILATLEISAPSICKYLPPQSPWNSEGDLLAVHTFLHGRENVTNLSLWNWCNSEGNKQYYLSEGIFTWEMPRRVLFNFTYTWTFTAVEMTLFGGSSSGLGCAGHCLFATDSCEMTVFTNGVCGTSEQLQSDLLNVLEQSGIHYYKFHSTNRPGRDDDPPA